MQSIYITLGLLFLYGSKEIKRSNVLTLLYDWSL